ncbi:histidine kinase [Singulisphaera rosea]
MELLSVEERAGSDLASALVQIASDPEQVCYLHRIVGSYCHQGRNILNSLKLSLYLARRDQSGGSPETWSHFEPGYQKIERLFERLQSICRPMTLSPMVGSLALLFDDRRASWTSAFASRNRTFEMIGPEEPAVGQFDSTRLGEAFDAFVAWRSECGPLDSHVRLSWVAKGGQFVIVWEESGLDDSLADSTSKNETNAFAFPLLARVVSAHGGSITHVAPGANHLEIRWPLDFRPR